MDAPPARRPHRDRASPLVSRDAGSFTLAAPRRAPRGVGEPATMLGIAAGPPPCDAPTWTPASLKEPPSRDTRAGCGREARIGAGGRRAWTVGGAASWGLAD